MLAQKTRVNLEELESQVALDLPDREMMLVTIVITNLLNNLSVDIDVRNNNVAVQVCAIVQAITAVTGAALDCDIQQ
jgi:hypothetical protein